MASGFPFPSVPWYTTNEAKFVGNVGLGPLAIAAAPNCSLKCNCKPGFEAFTEISKCAASRYWKSDDSSGAEVRRCCDPLSSSAAGYHLAGDLAKCSNNDSGTLLGSALKAISSTGPSIRCEEQRPCLQDDHITATCRQNAPISVVQSLNSGITRPRSGRASKTRNPTQKVSLGYKPYEPYSMDDGSYPKVSNKRFQDLEAGYRRSTNGEPEVEIYSNGLAAFSDSMNESYLQEDYKSGCGNHDNNEIKENGKVSKRKAGEMERKALAVEVESGNVDQKSRIVRISRLTGGKDRHSKVLTAKGIRDRRVRLSVPTAIQFYDLQDRLGFEQPSKAVDWLIHNARSSIDKLPVLDAEMAASTSAGNVTQLISSNSSPVEHCVSSPTHSATADAVSAFRFGMGSLESERTSSQKAMNENPRSNIVTLKDLELVRTTSSISDGTIERSVEHYTSNSSLTKPSSSRVQAIWKATERTKKKSTLAKISGRFASDIRQLKSMQPSLTNPFHGVLPYTRVPLESQHIKDDNPCEIHSQIMMSGTSSVQPLCDSNMPSYTGIVFTNQDSHPFQNMATLGSSAIHNCFPPVPSTSDSIYPIIGSYEMADSAIPFSDTLESRHLGGNAAHTQANLFYSNIHMNIMKSVDEQQQQQHIYKNFVSTILPTYSNDINFSTSSFSRRVPFQSNSSAFITNMPILEDSEGCGLW